MPIDADWLCDPGADGFLNLGRFSKLEVRSAFEGPPVAAGICGKGIPTGWMMVFIPRASGRRRWYHTCVPTMSKLASGRAIES